MDFIIGGISGMGATIFTNPIDVVKTRLQLQGELKSSGEVKARYRGMLHTMYVIGKTDGVLALQSGLAPAMVTGFAMNGIRLGLYHVAESNGWLQDSDNQLSVTRAVFWSSLSGGVSGLAGNPPSVVKTRLQAMAHPSIAVGRQHAYSGTWDACKTIYLSEGIHGFFAGLSATCTRLAIGSAAQLTTFSFCKQYLKAEGWFEDSLLLLSFTSAMFCGLTLVLLETPLDVVNTRLQNQGAASSKGGLLYTGIFDCLQKIAKTEGLQGLYKGVGPLYFRLAPHTTLSLVIWDLLNDMAGDSS